MAYSGFSAGGYCRLSYKNVCMMVFACIVAFILGVTVTHVFHKHNEGNMGVERYLQCVQIALSMPTGGAKDDKPMSTQALRVLLDEIGEYAMGEKNFEGLSPEAQDVVRLTPKDNPGCC
jgi:hypothetical protein